MGGNVYVLINVNTLTNIPTVTLPTSEMSALQLVLGGRWFELPEEFHHSYVPAKSASTADTAKDQAAAKKVFDAISKLINTTPYTTLPNGGFSQTGSSRMSSPRCCRPSNAWRARPCIRAT